MLKIGAGLKALAIDVTSPDGSAKHLSYVELEARAIRKSGKSDGR
jgi:hypothetical protein